MRLVDIKVGGALQRAPCSRLSVCAMVSLLNECVLCVCRVGRPDPIHWKLRKKKKWQRIAKLYGSEYDMV